VQSGKEIEMMKKYTQQINYYSKILFVIFLTFSVDISFLTRYNEIASKANDYHNRNIIFHLCLPWSYLYQPTEY